MKAPINWMARIKNKAFWFAIVPVSLLLIKQIAGLLGLEFNYEQISTQATDIINTVFLLLMILGIVVNPTTRGIYDNDVSKATTALLENEKDDNCGQ